MMRRFLLVLALLGLTGCTGGGDAGLRTAEGFCLLKRRAEIPVETHGDMLFVRATIRGTPVMLLVDTGAERTLLTEAAVERLHLPRDYQHATRTFGIGSPTATWDAKLPDGMILGDTHFPAESVTVGRFNIMHVAGEAADGLLGADVLLAFDVDIDAANSRLTLYHPRRACPEAGPPWAEPYIKLAGVVTRQDRLLLPFELDGVTGMAVLDTGAQLSSISIRMAQRLGVAEEMLAVDRIVMAHGAAPDQVAVRIHRFRELRIGPAVMHWPMLPVVPMTDGMGDALVGVDFLRGRRVWISFATNRMFVTPLDDNSAIADARSDER
jgi:predicted aspartyl protease